MVYNHTKEVMSKVFRNWIEIDGLRYYHYSLGVKNQSSKSVVVNGSSYYYSTLPLKDELFQNEYRMVS
jgi:hypothetical protein